MEKKRSFLRRSLAKALNFPWLSENSGKEKLSNGHFSEKEWRPATKHRQVEPLFDQFVAVLGQYCANPGHSAAPAEAGWLWEQGTLSHRVPYFYFQRFDEEGILIEQTDHGWFSIPAVKVVADDTFIRGQNVAESATVVFDSEGQPYIRSTFTGQRPVLLAMYADTYLEVLG